MDIMDKIQKLFALAGNNPNKEEAQAALLKAQELMAKYNIHEVEKGSKKSEITYKVIKKYSRLRKVARNSLVVTIAKAFAVKCVLMNGDYPTFYGYKENVEAAASAFVFCAKMMNKGANKVFKAEKENGASTAAATYAYNSYTLGFMSGLKAKFDEQCKALMIVVPTEVEKGFDEKFPNRKNARRSGVHGGVNNSTFSQGYADGKSAMGKRTLTA